MIISQSIADRHAKSIMAIREALEQRLTNASGRLSVKPSYHRGTPDPKACPDEPLGVWLDWTTINKDPDEPYEATMLVSNWKIYILTRNETNDAFGQEATLGERTWGEITTTLTQTTVDLGLDGTIDFIVTPEAAHGHGNISGGDRLVDAVELSLSAHHTMVERLPPQ